MPVFTQKLLHYTHIVRDDNGDDHADPIISARVGEFQDDWRSGECSIEFPESALPIGFGVEDVEALALKGYAEKQAAAKQARDDAKAARLNPPKPVVVTLDDQIAQAQAMLDELLAEKKAG